MKLRNRHLRVLRGPTKRDFGGLDKSTETIQSLCTASDGVCDRSSRSHNKTGGTSCEEMIIIEPGYDPFRRRLGRLDGVQMQMSSQAAEEYI